MKNHQFKLLILKPKIIYLCLILLQGLSFLIFYQEFLILTRILNLFVIEFKKFLGKHLLYLFYSKILLRSLKSLIIFGGSDVRRLSFFLRRVFPRFFTVFS